MTKEYCVYMHRFPNGKVYVGITCQDPEKRWNGGRGYQSNHGLFSEILKYGWINIEHLVLATGLTEEMASEEEKRLIEKYNSSDPSFGYNLQTGGVEGFTHNEEARKRIAVASKKRWEDPEYRKKVHDAQKEAQARPDVKKRKSEYAKNRYHSDKEYREKFVGAIRKRMNDPEVKKQYSEIAKRVWENQEFRERWHKTMSGGNNPSAKPVDQYTTDGRYIRTFSCCKEAAEFVGTHKSCICACAKGRQKTSGGYVWRYADGNEPTV